MLAEFPKAGIRLKPITGSSSRFLGVSRLAEKKIFARAVVLDVRQDTPGPKAGNHW